MTDDKTHVGYCKVCRKSVPIITKEELEKKLKPITRRSAKSKGMGCQIEVKEAICKKLKIPDGDAITTSSGVAGLDLRLSEAGKEKFPFHAIEIGNQQKLNIWQKFGQALSHGEKQKKNKSGNGKPILIFRRNHTELHAMVLFDDLLELILACDKNKLKKRFGQ